LVQFSYDAVIRSGSHGATTIQDIWRNALEASAKRSEYGVRPEAFLSASSDAQTLARGILDGSVDWSQFLTELDKHDAKLAMEVTDEGSVLKVKSAARAGGTGEAHGQHQVAHLFRFQGRRDPH